MSTAWHLVALVAFSAAGPAPRNPVGIHLLIQDYMAPEVIETHLAYTRHLTGEGGWIKPMIYPITVELQGAPDSWKMLIRRAYEMGLNACLRMDEPLGNASPPGAYGDYAEIAAAYRRVAEDLLKANPTSRPIYFEIRNEPNNACEWSNDPDPTEYGTFYVAVARALRAIGDPRVRVGPGALSPGGSYDNLKFIDVLCTVEGFTASIDAWMTHCYPGNHPPEINLHDGTAKDRYGAIDGYMEELERLRHGGVDTRNLPVLITEMAYDVGAGGGTFPTLTEDLRAEYFVRAWRDYWMQWPEVIAVCPYYLVSLWAKAPEQNEWVWAGTSPAFDGRPSQAHQHYWAVAGMAKPGELTGAINGVVRDQFGTPVQWAVVRLVGGAVPSLSNSAGLFQHSALVPGEYTLTVSAPGHEAVAATVSVAAGGNTHYDPVLPLHPPFGETIVTVQDVVEGKPLSNAVVSIDAQSRMAVTDSSGEAVLRGLRPGYYDVLVRRDGYGAAQGAVEIRDGTSTRFAVALTANLLDNGGLEPLQPGDRSVASGWQSADRAPHPWLQLDNTIKHSGNTSQRIDVAAAGDNNLVSHWTGYSSVTLGATYEAEVYAKTLGLVPSASAGAQLRLLFYSNDDEHNPVSVVRSASLHGDSNWTRLTVSAVAPKRADRLRTVLLAEGSAGSAWFDDVVLREVQPSVPSLFERGKALGAAWRERGLFSLNTVWGLGGSSFGMTDERFTRLVQLMHEAGAPFTKLGIAWGDIERTQGNKDWTYTDRMVDQIAGQGFEIVAVYCCVADWAKGMRPEDYQAFGGENAPLATVVLPQREFAREYREFSAEMAARYRGKVNYFEFWNEPDSYSGPILLRDRSGKTVDVRYNGDPVEYTYWLRQTYLGIKQGNPAAQVAVGGLVSAETGFLETIYANGGGEFFDAVAIHPYHGQGIDKHWIREMRAVMRRHGDFHKPLWMTEYGWWIGARDADIARGIYPAGLTDQARWLREAIEFFRRHPFIAIASHHTLNDWRTDENNPASVMAMGLVTCDLAHTKPAYQEWQELVEESLERFGGTPVVCRIELQETVFLGTTVPVRCSIIPEQSDLPAGRAVLYRLPDEQAVATWEIAPSAATREFEAHFRPLPEDLTRDGNGFAFEFRRVPGRVVARTERFVDVVSPLAFGALPSATEPYDLEPDQRAMVRVTNYGPQPVSFVPGGDLNGRGVLVLPAGNNMPLALGLRLPSRPLVGTFCVAALVDGVTWAQYSQRYFVPLHCRRTQSATPQLLLAPQPQIGGMAGPHANVYTYWTSEALFLRVETEEPEYTQTRPPRDMWMEDSLQVAFDVGRDGATATRYDANDYEFGFALCNEKPVAWRWAAPPETSYVGEVPTVGVKIRHAKGKTVYNVAIPWAELGIDNPEPGRLLGICLCLNDLHEGQRRYAEWPAGGITAGKKPCNFGSLRLVE